MAAAAFPTKWIEVRLVAEEYWVPLCHVPDLAAAEEFGRRWLAAHAAYRRAAGDAAGNGDLQGKGSVLERCTDALADLTPGDAWHVIEEDDDMDTMLEYLGYYRVSQPAGGPCSHRLDVKALPQPVPPTSHAGLLEQGKLNRRRGAGKKKAAAQ